MIFLWHVMIYVSFLSTTLFHWPMAYTVRFCTVTVLGANSNSMAARHNGRNCKDGWLQSNTERGTSSGPLNILIITYHPSKMIQMYHIIVLASFHIIYFQMLHFFYKITHWEDRNEICMDTKCRMTNIHLTYKYPLDVSPTVYSKCLLIVLAYSALVVAPWLHHCTDGWWQGNGRAKWSIEMIFVA